MFDKAEARRTGNSKSYWAQYDWRNRQHHERLKRFIEAMPKKLICQECGGAGGEIEPVPGFYGQGPWYPCSWCHGIGYITPHARGLWLRLKRADRSAA